MTGHERLTAPSPTVGAGDSKEAGIGETRIAQPAELP